MRSAFLEWYPLPEPEREAVWKNGTVVLDTNVILDIYRYPDDARAQFLDLLDSLNARLWMPHQVGLEYLRSREGIVPGLRSAVNDVIDRIEKAKEVLQSLPLPENHPILNNDDVAARVSEALAGIEPLAAVVTAALQETESLVESADADNDPIWTRITNVFEDRVGPPWPAASWAAFIKEARARFESEVPPGFRDAKKDEPECFGDLLIWKQVIAAAVDREVGRRCTVFVTNDRKEDWWERRRGELLGPRRELVREYFDATEERVVMVTSSEFLAGAKKYLSAEVTGETIADVERVSAEQSVTTLLWHKRMTLPPFDVRNRGLELVYDAVRTGRVTRAGDLDELTNEVASWSPVSSYVTSPLFFSLVNRTYGPLEADENAQVPLRDRPLSLRSDSQSRSGFMDRGHAAWLAQALFRIWHQDVADDAVLTTYFPEPSGWARQILRTAKGFVLEAQGAKHQTDDG